MVKEHVAYTTVDGRRISSIGIGTYLGNTDDETDQRMERCLIRAIAYGINLIDTAPNYRAERSEEVLGRVIACLKAKGLDRREIVVCTKVGFLPYHREIPAATELPLRRRFLDSGVLHPDWIQGRWQSFHPEYIKWQFAESLARLQCDYIDIYYLHNPEGFLLNHPRPQVERIIRQAFETVSSLCQRKLVRYVGVASWNAFTNQVGLESLSLAEVVNWAAAAGIGEPFRFVQLPLNLGLPTALTGKTQEYEGRDWSAIRLAQQLNLNVIASAPLLHGRLPRLSLPQQLTRVFPHARTSAQICLEFTRSAPGVTAAVVGVTNEAHLEELLEIASQPKISEMEYVRAFS